MKFILCLALIALSVASPAREQDAAYTDDYDEDQVDYHKNQEENDQYDYPISTKTTDYQEEDSQSRGSDQPTITEVIFGRPSIFPMRPTFFRRPLFPMGPIFPRDHFFPFSGEDDSSEEYNNTSSDDDFFPNIFSGSSFGEPDLKDLPPNYQNSTYEVKNINGSKVHVNQTVNKKSGDGFNSFFHFKTVKIVPEYDTENDSTPIEEGSGYDVVPGLPSEVKPKIQPEVKPEVQPEVSTNVYPTFFSSDDEPAVTTKDQIPAEDEPKVPTKGQPQPEDEPEVSTKSQPPAEDEAVISKFNSIDYSNKIDSSDSSLDKDKKDLENKKFHFKRSISLPRFAYVVDDPEEETEGYFPDEGARVLRFPSEEEIRPRTRSFALGNTVANQNRNTNFLENLRQSNYDRSLRTNYRTNYVYKNVDGRSYIYKLPHKTPNIRIDRPFSHRTPKKPYIMVVKKGNSPRDTFESDPEGTIENILSGNAQNTPEPNLQILPLNVRKTNSRSDYRNHLERTDIGPIVSDSEIPPESNIGKTQALDNLRVALDNYIHAEGDDRGRNNNEDEVETILVIRPPDLSGDTKVNKIAADRSTSQQGLTLIDPDIEVFDLALVLKELQSHDDDVYIANN